MVLLIPKQTYWPEYKKNKESVGQLWFGLLQFYTETFDFKETVICICRKEPLTTFKKQWASKHLAIEGKSKSDQEPKNMQQ